MTETGGKILAERYDKQFKHADPAEILEYFLKEYRGRIGFSTSLGAEDQVLTEMISAIDRGANVFTLDTGRLFPETYDLIDITEKRYGIKINVFFPDAVQVENMVREKGINLFYESVANRKLCCHIRKIEPLKRALTGLDIWISGLRREQSITRNHLDVVEWDALHGKLKVNPLLDWTTSQIWDYIQQYNIPYSPLHDKGYPSIGCLPCTRAVDTGEDIRAGRWWWENPEMKECGLHRR